MQDNCKQGKLCKIFMQDFQNNFLPIQNLGTIKVLKLAKISAKKNFHQN